MTLAPIELLLLIGMVALIVTLWGVIDAAGRPDEAWVAAGQSKVLWIVLQAIGLVFWPGVVMAIVYLVTIRPRLRAGQPE